MARTITLLLILLVAVVLPSFSYAQDVDELREQIQGKASEIAELEEEIREYEGKISETKQEASSLSSLISELSTTEKKLETDIVVTEKRIENTSLNIQKLDIEIGSTQERIEQNKEVIAETIRLLQEATSNSLVEVVFFHDTFSEFWGNINNLETLQKSITVHLEDLQEDKVSLEKTQDEAVVYKTNLGTLQEELSDQKEVTIITKQEKETLLDVTKSEQANYEALLEERLEKKRLFEEELLAIEAALEEALDSSSLPVVRPGVLDWPLKNFFITQYFGDTPFATQNPSVYGGKGHNGVDFGVPIGTPIHAPRDGIVVGIGNTDDTCRNASYGKWILVEHGNGLSTLYAHLSLIKSSSGEAVSRGDIIGYTGNTGYSTGPHLHFTVFGSDAVEVGNLTSRACAGAVYQIPLLTKQGGYLNPLSYLPSL